MLTGILSNHRFLWRWIAGTAGPFKRYHLDLIYGCGTSGFNLQAPRVKHFWKLLIRYQSGIWKRLAKHGRSLQ